MLSTALLLLLSAKRSHPRQSRFSRWFRYISYMIAALLTPAFFAAVLVSAFPIKFLTLMKLSAYNLVLHVAAGFALFRGDGLKPSAVRAYSRLLLLMSAGLALGLLFLIHFSPGRSLSDALRVIAQQSSIPMAIISLVYLAQFRLADVFVKRSLTILAAVIIALVYALFIVEPLTRNIREQARYPEAGNLVVVTILWSGLLLLFPVLARAADRMVDRWLFQRPDYRKIARDFSQQCESMEDTGELFDLVGQKIETALGASCRVISQKDVQELGDALLPASGDVIQLPGGSEVETLVPIKVNAAVKYVAAISAGERGRKLLSDEIAFLLTMAERAGRKIESLQFESERHERNLRELRLQHLLTEAELKALRAQVNPHFLFNTLNTIADLIASEPEKAELMTERLAEVFRYALARTDRNLISVGEEFEFLRTYLEIEQARFGDRLKIELLADQSILAEPIPSLILQPLVENSIKHGLAPKPGGGTVCVRAIDEGEFLRLVVEDDGAGWKDFDARLMPLEFEEEPPARNSRRKSGIGLRNITERLRALYGDRAELAVRSQADCGTFVSLLIPKYEVENPDSRRRSVREVAAAEAAERPS